MNRLLRTNVRTVGGSFVDFEAEHNARGNRPETVRQTIQRLRNLHTGVETLVLRHLTEERCRELYRTLAAKYAPGTHQRALETAREWAEWCVKQKWIARSPWVNVEKMGRAADHRGECLRVEEAAKLRLALIRRGDARAVGTLIALLQSCSPHEIVQITARDVERDGQILWIDGERLKTSNRRRSLDVVDPALAGALAKLMRGQPPATLLFPFHRDFVTDTARVVGADLGLGEVTFRMIRRTFASLDQRRGAGLDATAFAMGHGADKTGRTARRYYIAPGASDSGAARRAFAVLEGESKASRGPAGKKKGKAPESSN